MRHIFLTILLAITLSVSVHAKVPPEVMEPYNAYAAALKKGDEQATYDNALLAWKKAEKAMGDNRTTGDLAHNFADLFSIGKNPYRNYKTRLKARKRSIELAKFYPADEIGGVEVERRLKLAEMSLSLNVHKGGGKLQAGGKGIYFDEVQDAIESYNMQGGVFEGDLNVLQTRFYYLRKQYEKSLKHAEKATSIYQNPTDTYTSHYPLLLRIYKGESLKASDKPILATLEFQSVMQNLEGKLPAEHPFINQAFNKWMSTRSGLEDAGRLEEAELAGVCECWPFEDYKSKASPIKRVPPVMPAKFAEGFNSGHVVVMYDVNDDGQPINIKAISSTSTMLNDAAVKSVEDWEYSKRTPAESEKDRQGISTKISFRLTGYAGRILPEP